MRNGRLLAFECMEYSDSFRWIDVADDICRVLDVFEAHRARVRAKVTALWIDLARSREVDLGLARRRYQAYVDAASSALAPKRPPLVLMEGLSGSGKTWIATRLAPLLRAIHLRSDVER